MTLSPKYWKHLSTALLISLTTIPTVSFSADQQILRLEEMDLSHMIQGWGVPGINKTILDKPLTINGQVFEHGVGSHAISRVTIDLKGSATAFHAQVGLDDEEAIHRGEQGSVVFHVYVDKEKTYTSNILKYKEGPELIEIDLTGAQTLDLEIMDADGSIDFDHADWADTYLVLAPDAKETPETLPRPKLTKEILTPPEMAAPRINAAGVIGAGANREFSYYVPITGIRPLTVIVDGLPDTISYDAKSQMLKGTTTISEPEDTNATDEEKPEPTAEYKLTITATNTEGTDQKEVLLTIGKGLAKTPPMGYNSWNCFGKEVTERNIRDAAEGFVNTGMIDYGWTYVCVDDAWSAKERDKETMRLTGNERFPDMKKLADDIHDMGLKFGIYSDVGYYTCQKHPGSRGYDFLDADTYASWGVDYIKSDWCYARGMGAEASFKTLGLAIKQTNRDMVLCVCTPGLTDPWTYAEAVGGNLWRTGTDIRDNWHSVYTRVSEKHYSLYEYAKPGHWNDPDMLVVGKVGWGDPLHDSELTPNQQYSHISLWSILAAPLLVGCDMAQVDDFTLGLLTNAEIIAVDQDILGKQGQRIIQEDRMEVWKKELNDGSYAVGIFNFKPTELDETALRDYTLTWESIGLSGPQKVRDLWRQKDLGTFKEDFKVQLQEYGCIMLKVSPEK